MFSNKYFLLTGASKGIGYQIAKNLARNNAKLILISRTESELSKLINDFENKEIIHYKYPIDISDGVLVKKMFLELETKISHLDGIINCAGTFGTIGKIELVRPDEFIDSFMINLFGSYNIIHYGLFLINKSKRGKIINFSGGGATNPFPNYSGYSCSKIALVKLTENLALEQSDLDINIIAPGFIKTDLANQTLKSGEKAGLFFNKTLEMLKDGGDDIKDVIDLVSYLLSNNSDNISGKLISAPWDEWRTFEFQEKLRMEKDFCSLRRIDGHNFIKYNQ